MKRLLNTLYVTTQGAYLARQNEALLVRVEKQTKLRVPVHTLGAIVCFGQVSVSPPLMGLCGERQVAIAFLSERGRFWARVEGPVSGNVLLRREQYRRADDDEAAAEIARAVVIAKIANSRAVLLRGARDRPDGNGAEALTQAAAHLATLLKRLRRQPGMAGPALVLDTIRGLEGDAARAYFGAFNHLITAQEEDFAFTNRNRRPPVDNINALLSFLYTLLVHDATSAVQAIGLDPAVGYLHRDRPGRPGLALDLIEEFRAFLADRLALSLINRRQIKASGFIATETGAVTMDDDTRKAVLVAWQKRKQEEIQHPFLDEKMSVGLLLHAQALLLARRLRGDLDAYPAYIWK